MELGSMRSLVYVFAVMLTAELLVQANCRRGFYSITNRDPAINRFRATPRRKLPVQKSRCREYHSSCVPWTNNPRVSCCESSNLTCKCNLWGQNCKCTSKMWGR